MKSFKEFLEEDLGKWFGGGKDGDWKRIDTTGKVAGDCAKQPGESKPKCMSKAKRDSLSRRERANAVRTKRKHDKVPNRSGGPIPVSNYGKGKIGEGAEPLVEKNIPTSPALWSRAKAMAKSKFRIYPSAYANGWAVQRYKSLGGGWRKG